MLLEQSLYWTKVQAYVPYQPSKWQLLRSRLEWQWIEWQIAAKRRRDARVLQRLQDAYPSMPQYLRRDIGLP